MIKYQIFKGKELKQVGGLKIIPPVGDWVDIGGKEYEIVKIVHKFRLEETALGPMYVQRVKIEVGNVSV